MQQPKITLTVILTFLLSGCEQPPAEKAAPPPPEVSVAKPLAKQVTDWDEFSGRLQAVKAVDIRARVSGYLQSVDFKEGAMVEKGDLLFVIDPRPYASVLNEASAEVTRAKVQVQLQKQNLARAERLYKTQAIPEEELDTRTQAKAAALAALQAAEAKVESARLNVEFTHVRAPISGRIGRTMATEGNLVSGGNADATELTSIVSLDPIYFYFSGNEQIHLRYLRLARAGSRPSSRSASTPTRLRLTDEADFLHIGKMDFVDNRVDAATDTIEVRAIFPNPEQILVPGMFASIQVRGRGPYAALMIPDAALGTDQSQQFVFVVDDDNIAQRRPVQPGRIEGDLRIIGDGLSADDRVIVNGIQRVKAGAPVDPQSVELNLNLNLNLNQATPTAGSAKQ